MTLPAGWYPGNPGWGFQHCNAFLHAAKAVFDLCLQDKQRPLSVPPILHYALLIVGCHVAVAL